jgi:proteic killer suppression protein
VEISFASERLRELCNVEKNAKKQLGAKNAKILRQRLDDLSAVQNLFGAYDLGGKLHALKGDRAEQYAMRLDGGYRLVFRCAHEPPPRNADGAIDARFVTAIQIVAIEDYHD